MTKEQIIEAFRQCAGMIEGEEFCLGCPYIGQDGDGDWCYDKLNHEVLRLLEGGDV